MYICMCVLSYTCFYLLGPAGRKPGIAKPFDSLNAQQLKDVLRSRDVLTDATTKKDPKKQLKATLTGVQRAPSLLLRNPTQPLASLHLQDYEVLPCEPLHDIKGHIEHVLEELPDLLDDRLQAECKLLLAADLTGSDYRRAIIHVVALLRKQQAPEDVCRLMETLVIVTEI